MDETVTLTVRKDAPLREVEVAYINHVMLDCGKNRTLAAKILGVSTTTLRNKFRNWVELQQFWIPRGPNRKRRPTDTAAGS